MASIAKDINFFFNRGGMGDHIAKAPMLAAALRDFPQTTFHIYLQAYLFPLFQNWFSAAPNVKFYDLRMQSTSQAYPGYWCGEGFHTPLGTHPVDFAFQTYLDRTPEQYEKYYLPLELTHRQRLVEAGQYVVLTPGFTAKTRALPVSTWNEIISELHYRGVLPVLLGKKDGNDLQPAFFEEGLETRGCLDLRDRTTLIEAAEIMDSSSGVVGLDNGLIHLAACTKAPIVAAYSTQLAHLRQPYREQPDSFYAIQARANCTGCEVNIRFTFDHDFRECFYGHYACVKSGITANDFIKGLEKLGCLLEKTS